MQVTNIRQGYCLCFSSNDIEASLGINDHGMMVIRPTQSNRIAFQINEINVLASEWRLLEAGNVIHIPMEEVK